MGSRNLLFSLFAVMLVSCGDGTAAEHDASVDATGTVDSSHGDIAAELLAIDGMISVQELPSDQPGYRYFRLIFEQLADHDDPEGQKFGQLLTLHHRDYGAPMVLASTGYANYMGDRLTEPTRLLHANQLVVEHRFFDDSRPDPADWDLLRIRQAAADHHRIVAAFADLYSAAWVSTGGSKGGMTSIYHRRFYPDDVAATIPYVAPISFGVPDQGYQSFFDTVGSETCRTNLHAFQRQALLRRSAMEAKAAIEAASEGYVFDIIGGLEVAFESEVTGFEWGFWQYLGDPYCDYIPTATATDDQIYDFFTWLGGVGNSNDDDIMWFMPYYFQSEVELGYPAYHADYLDDLVLHADVPFGDVYPAGFDRTYDPTAMTDIADWVASEGSELLFLYGEYDPWTAGEFDLGAATDSYKLVAPRANHGASIAALQPADLEIALAALEAWTGVVPDQTALRSARQPEPPRYLPRHR